jgi:aminoglycoside phosphotransferase family enzyme/predicted kinase
MADNDYPDWLDALLQADAYPHPVQQIELVETHISYVLLTGDYAYKIKKSLDLGFLDFSTLPKREFYCREELRLNRRLASEIYLDVVIIVRSGDGIRIVASAEGEHDILEYAVKMVQFDPQMGFDHLLQRQQLTLQQLDQLALQVGQFHATIPAASIDSDYGSPATVRQPCLENFSQIRQHLPTLAEDQQLRQLEQWTRDQMNRLENLFIQRQQAGAIRECHGDMHLRNIALWRDHIVVFDCIEFNPALRWIDTISEIAFLIMDLDAHQANPMGWYFLNRYLEQTGDYRGVPLLRFYLVYRAMVRAKVAAIEYRQHALAEHQQELQHYLDQADAYTRPGMPCLFINRGFSGSGKSYVTDKLLQQLGCVRLRSDVERSRLFGQQSLDDKTAEIGTGKYSARAGELTYQHLLELSRLLLQAGCRVIVDAAFLRHAQRQPFARLAKQLSVPFRILAFEAEPEIMKQRIRERQAARRDASEADIAVLEHQLQHHDPLDAEETRLAIRIDTGHPLDYHALATTLKQQISAGS